MSKEKADFFASYDLDECRDRRSKRPEVRHQEKAINKLQEWFEKREFPSGTILTLPTGSGKTFTAVRFLCKYPLREGYKVLWLAHTHHLLEQAFFSFVPDKSNISEGYEIGWILDGKDELNIRVVSGGKNHFDVSEIKQSDDIIISTLQTIVGAYKNEHSALESFLNSTDGKLIVVFDEAHHAPAPSYRKLLIGDKSKNVRKSLRERFPEMYLLGLTATPTYTDKTKSGWLNDIFPQKIIYQADINRLILENILAEPEIIKVKTNIKPNVDEGEYKKLVNRYRKDIPKKIIKRLAKNKDRNQYIADNYNKEIYGKTIIFTDFIEQCEHLNNYLLAKNKNLRGDNIIRSDVMYSRTDKERNDEVLEKFRNNELDVIVNVKMLTEGTDVPDVDTVFLTRQTTSDILLTQMVGRALRGPRFGGKEKANLVFFTDDWERIVNWATWDSKSWSAKGEMEIIGDSPPLDLISIDLMQKLIRDIGPGGKNKVNFLNLFPVGWYQVNFYNSKKEDEKPVEMNELVLVFENNEKSYDNFIEHLKTIDINEFSPENAKLEDHKERLILWHDKFFSETKYARDNVIKNLFSIVRHMAQNKKQKPEFIKIREREKYDMDLLATKYMGLSRELEDQSLLEVYNDKDLSWNALYPDYDHFKTQYNACVEWILEKRRKVNEVPVLSEEEKQIQILNEGSAERRLEACMALEKMIIDNALHESTIDILYRIMNKEENNNVRKAAKNAIGAYNRKILPPKTKTKVKERDNFTCLCCGEKRRYTLQIDHIRPQWVGVDNSEDNLQTLCNKCNAIKGRANIDFRKTYTDLKVPPQKFTKINEIEYGAEKRFVKYPEWWKKILKRGINFFYQCNAVKSINIGKRGIYFHRWEINLNEGNDPQWILPFVMPLTTKIRAIRKSHGLSGPDKICIVGPDSDIKVLDTIQKLGSLSVYERRNAATKLGNLKSREAVHELIKSLDDMDRFVPRNAATSLGKIGDERAIEPLITKLKSEDSELRQRSKTAIVKIGKPAIEKLIPSLKNKDVYVRQLSAEALGLIGDENITEYLSNGLSDDESTVRWRVARALGEIGDIKSISSLENLVNDPDKKVREEVQNALRKIKNDNGLHGDGNSKVKLMN